MYDEMIIVSFSSLRNHCMDIDVYHACMDTNISQGHYIDILVNLLTYKAKIGMIKFWRNFVSEKIYSHR